MRKAIAYLAQSLDGFISDKDEKVDFLNEVEIEGDAGYSELYDSIDTVIMGYTTYEWIVKNAIEYPYKDKISYVITSKDINIPDINITNDVKKLIDELKLKDGKDIWVVGGGRLISSMIASNSLDYLHLTIAPILLGDGTKLFSDVNTKLRLLNVKRYKQFIELDYELSK